MTFIKKDSGFYLIIFLGLFVALMPVVLSNNYLRQDDLKTGIWWGMKMSDEGYLYYNTVMQLVRPICMILFFLIDLISLNMHDAVYVRLASIINVCVLGILLYRWQLFFNSNRLLAATFAIASFTLPAIQLFAATANYFLIIFAILLTFGGPFYWYKSFEANTHYEKNKYLFIGILLFFLSFLDYPFSSMYVWVMLGISYLNSLIANENDSIRLKKFFYYGSFLAIAVTAFYFVFMHIFQWLFHVDLTFGRVGTSNPFDIIPRSIWIFEILISHSLFWDYSINHWLAFYPIITILFLLGLALVKIGIKRVNNGVESIYKNLITIPGVLFILFFLCYLPALAAPENEISHTFRYALATMPLLMYIIFWSIHTIVIFSYRPYIRTTLNIVSSLFFIFVALFGIYYSNYMTSDGIVGPQDNDFRFLEAELQRKVVPLLQQHKLVALHVIDCDHGKNYKFEKNVPDALEYGMRLCAFPHHLVGAINHSMLVLGYSSNYQRMNSTFSDGDIFFLKDVPWGNLIVSSSNNFDKSHLDYPIEKMTVVTIDMREIPPYQHFGLYKRILGLTY